jgi:hypothetical protein
MEKKTEWFNHGLTLVNGAIEVRLPGAKRGRNGDGDLQRSGDYLAAAYFSTLSRTISIRVSLTLRISNS